MCLRRLVASPNLISEIAHFSFLYKGLVLQVYLLEKKMFDDLAKLIEEKYISVQTHEQDSSLKIYNYTAKTQFDNFWNETTMHCRGLIMRKI